MRIAADPIRIDDRSCVFAIWSGICLMEPWLLRGRWLLADAGERQAHDLESDAQGANESGPRLRARGGSRTRLESEPEGWRRTRSPCPSNHEGAAEPFPRIGNRRREPNDARVKDPAGCQNEGNCPTDRTSSAMARSDARHGREFGTAPDRRDLEAWNRNGPGRPWRSGQGHDEVREPRVERR